MKPLFEALSQRRRTDQTLVDMKTAKGRDNIMYRLTDTYNLDEEVGPGVSCRRNDKQ